MPQVKAYLNGVKVPRLLRLKTLLVKVLGAIGASAGGMAIGKEGSPRQTILQQITIVRCLWAMERGLISWQSRPCTSAPSLLRVSAKVFFITFKI